MKKVFKTVLIVIGTIVGLILLYIGFLFAKHALREMRLEHERVYNNKTLTDYIESHDSEHLQCGGCGEMNFTIKNLICEDLKNKDIKYINYRYFVTKDNEVYEYVTDKDKKYSNNEQCKKMDLGFDVESTKISYKEIYFYDKNGKKYRVTDNYSENLVVEEYKWDGNADKIIKNDKSYLELLHSESEGENYNDILIRIYSIKDDNNIHLEKFKLKDLSKVSDEILYNKEEYGKILRASMYIENEKPVLEYMITDTNIYSYQEEITEECEKYEDIKCEKKLVKSELYDRYKNDIKFVGDNYSVLKDNSIIGTEELFSPLDKKIK